MERILVIRFSSLGDVVLLSALLTGVRQRHPHAHLTLVTKERYAELYAGDPRVDALVPLRDAAGAGALRAVAAQLESQTFDRIIDAHNTLRSRVLTWWLPPAPTVRLRKDTAARLLFLKTRLRTRALRRHMLDRYAELVSAEATTSEVAAPCKATLALTEADRQQAAALLPGATAWLAVAPGARHLPKRWPIERTAALLARFQHAHSVRIVIVGGEDEREACEQVAAALPARPLVHCGDLSLRALAAVLGRCRLLLCNDSGLMHMAEAVGTPVLAIFGPTSREFGYFPSDSRSLVIEHALECRPCSRNGARPCRMPEQWCMTRSTVDLVESQLERQWRDLSEASPA